MKELSYLIVSVFYALIFFTCYKFIICEPATDRPLTGRGVPALAGLGLLALLFFQSVASGFFPGHVQDTGLFRAWASFAEDHAVREYYTTDLYVDYPPVYLYVLYALGTLMK